MAIVKEDGTGLETANVYADVVDLEAYAVLRGEDLSSKSEAEKEAALYIAANDWIDGEHEFNGLPVSAAQGLKLPTNEVSLPNKDIVNANCYTALLQLKGALFVTATASTGSRVKKTKKKLDVMETETEYFEDGSTIPNTTIADNMISDYLSTSGEGFGIGNVSY